MSKEKESVESDLAVDLILVVSNLLGTIDEDDLLPIVGAVSTVYALRARGDDEESVTEARSVRDSLLRLTEDYGFSPLEGAIESVEALLSEYEALE